MTFRDRTDAGRRLGAALQPWGGRHPVVLALPRGGVVVAAEVAAALDAPLDVLVVRKIGVPWRPELGVGALAEGGTIVLDPTSMHHAGVTDAALAPVIAEEHEEVARRVLVYRGGRPLPPLAGRCVLLVDDGVATGGTALAAIRAARSAGAAEVVLAVPVAAASTLRALEQEATVVALLAPPDLLAIGEWYDEFEQVTDARVLAALRRPVP